jgi:hypothetical protein
VNRSDALTAEVPPGVTTVTSTVAEPAGEIAVIDVDEFTVNAAPFAPNRTAVAPMNPVPVTVTLVAPASGPEDGLIAVTAGVAK